jgi:hypothetical protein
LGKQPKRERDAAMISRDIAANRLQPNPAIDDLRRYRRTPTCKIEDADAIIIIIVPSSMIINQHRFRKWI